MSIWFALFLGLMHGLTEFLPVSNSGHQAILQHFFKMDTNTVDYLLFDILLNIATLISILIFYWRDLKGMGAAIPAMFAPRRQQQAKHKQAARLLLLLVTASLPLIVFSFFGGTVQQLSMQPLFIGIALISTGLLLWLSDMIPKGKKDEKTATFVDVLMVGLMQGIATIPGLSRAGLTISTGLFRRFDRRFAVRFSFLMSIPAALGVILFKVGNAAKEGVDVTLLPLYLAGMVVACLVGYGALCLMRVVAERSSFKGFAYYCLILGVVTILATVFTQFSSNT